LKRKNQTVHLKYLFCRPFDSAAPGDGTTPASPQPRPWLLPNHYTPGVPITYIDSTEMMINFLIPFVCNKSLHVSTFIPSHNQAKHNAEKLDNMFSAPQNNG
jgi:hypothetical protein